ncbi:integrase, catalytic region, zinc finger, CCHC-type containing protein [Tanacetum coccineum]
MACDVSWKSRMKKLSDENVVLKTQVESVVQERENDVSLRFRHIYVISSLMDMAYKDPIFESYDMSTSKTYQQSLADAYSKNMPPMLEMGSYIPWASRFRRYLNRKRDNRKWLLKALDEGPYEFKNFVMNMILLSIPNEIYNSVDAYTSAKDIWKRVERLMRGTIQNKVDRETYFTNEFDQFVAEPEEALVSVYNHFAYLQPEWLKYVTQVHLAKRLTVDSFDDLFDYLQQIEKLVNASRAKKLEKSHDPLALVAQTGSSSRQTSSYYVTHPTYVVDYDDEYQQDDVHNNSEDPLVSAINQAIIQGDRVNIQSRNSGITGRNSRQAYVQEEVVEGMNAPKETENVQRTLRTPSSGNILTVQCYNCSEKGHYASNCPKPRVRDLKYFIEQMLWAKQDEASVILTNEQNDFLFADASRMEEIEELSANICLMARIQPADHTSDDGPSYESAFISEHKIPLLDVFLLSPACHSFVRAIQSISKGDVFDADMDSCNHRPDGQLDCTCGIWEHTDHRGDNCTQGIGVRSPYSLFSPVPAG